jgi:hypothetical protein
MKTMRKVLFILAAIVPLLFAGCNKDNDDSDDSDDSVSLEGTTWICLDDYAPRLLEFSKKTFVMTWEVGTTHEDSASGTYTYNPPKIVLNADDVSVSGRVDENQLVLDEGVDYPFIFEKQ